MHIRRLLVPVAFVAGVGLNAACHSSSSAAAASGPVARFKLSGDTPPNYLDVPFPSDAYVQGGTIVEPLPGLDAIVTSNSSFLSHGLASNNGFSRIALATFAVDDPTAPPNADGTVAAAVIDPTTLPVAETDCTTDASSVYVLDLSATDPTQARIPCRAGYHNDAPRSSTTPVIAVGPARGILLDEGKPYAVVVTSRVKDTAGRALGASSDLHAIAANPTAGVIAPMYGQAYATASTLLKSALATDGAQIVAIAPYHAMTKTHELFAMRDALEAAAPPTLAWDAATMAPMGATKFAAPVNGVLPAGFTATLDAWLGVATQKLANGQDDPSSDLPVRAHDQIASIGSAVFSAMSYMQVKPNGYSDPEHHVFAYDASGNPVPQAPVKIWITFAVPTSAMPAAGYPTIIVQHGLSGSRADEFMDLANVLCAQGWLVAAIDSVTFGARADEAMYQVDTINLWEDSPGVTYKGPDGFADPVLQDGKPDPTGATNGSFDMFGGLQNILAIRDQFREAGFDTAQLVQLLRSGPDLSPLDVGSGAPKINASQLGYIGDSLGAMEGTIAAAIEPRISAWVLNVNGGGLIVDLGAHSPTIGLQIAEAAAFNFGFNGDHFSETHPLMQVLQDILDGGDPISYAPFLVKSPQPLVGKATPARNALQVQVVYDEIVANEANEAIARAGGWGMGTPNVGSNAEVWDLTTATANPRATPFAQVSPDATGAIHDTPVAGTTAVLIQCSPCAHGQDIVNRTPGHSFSIPFFDPDGTPDYQVLSPPFDFTEPFQGIQAASTTFLSDALAGKVPRVMGFTAPVRDYDGDGFPEDKDAFPNDPTKH